MKARALVFLHVVRMCASEKLEPKNALEEALAFIKGEFFKKAFARRYNTFVHSMYSLKPGAFIDPQEANLAAGAQAAGVLSTR